MALRNCESDTPTGDVPDESLHFKPQVDRMSIAQSTDSCADLQRLDVDVYSQDSLERGIISQVERQLGYKDDSVTCEGNFGSPQTSGNVEASDTTVHTKGGRLLAGVFAGSQNDAVKFGESTPFELIAETKTNIAETGKTNIGDEREICSSAVKESEAEEGDIDPDFELGSSDNDDSDDGNYSIASPDTHSLARGRKKAKKTKIGGSKAAAAIYRRLPDDGNDKCFEKRIKLVRRKRLEEQLVEVELTGRIIPDSEKLIDIGSGLSIPAELWSKLYKYQRTGVRWLWELHNQNVGGILGDEMGLGKTIQLIAFLSALSQSQNVVPGHRWRGLGPSVVVCPATIIDQWVSELHRWAPHIRVAVFHNTGSHRGHRQALVAKIAAHRRDGSMLITSYGTMTQERDLILKHKWHYVILDEGHKIRNPDAQVTLAVKRFPTAHRLILSGSPMQNSLKELWSLIDFVYPGRLGSLKTFLEELAVPITQGGYANASPIQVRTAYKCACVLRDAINPYLLRRMKEDVQLMLHLPSKNEQVLFCHITEEQRRFYTEYLQSRQCERILSGGIDAFVGLILLRKLCNHPDLVTGGPNRLGDLDEKEDSTVAYGHFSRSGKMMVVRSLLKLWKEQGHKVLLFSQSRQMLNILEMFVKSEGYHHLRMDGGTSIGSRQGLVRKFNSEPDIFVFLLTTRVGGIGVNLTGANRVLIFDPDWNPSTDTQARERAWRIGQHRPVTIYRLLTSGTIEEKIYHRQIFKQFLTNRILKDPKQRRFFKTNDLHELFTLADKTQSTETDALFAGTGSQVIPKKKAKRPPNFFDDGGDSKPIEHNSKPSNDEEDMDFLPSELIDSAKLKKLRDLAKRLSEQFTQSMRDDEDSSALHLKSDKRSGGRKHHSRKRVAESCKSRVLFDGATSLPYLADQKPYQPGDKDSSNDDETVNRHQDDYVLSRLFKKSGVHGALKHETVVGSGDADYSVVEMEAEKVAAKAAKVLAEWRRRISTNPLHSQQQKPRFGPKAVQTKIPPMVKHPTKRRIRQHAADNAIRASLFDGNALLQPASQKRKEQSGASSSSIDLCPSSSDLLSAIRSRRCRNLESDDESDDGVDLPDGTASTTDSSVGVPCESYNRYDSLAKDLQTYIALKDGQTSTKDILTKFHKVVSTKESNVFRAILKRLCNFKRLPDNSAGIWELKEEYK